MDIVSLNEKILEFQSTNPELFYSIVLGIMVWKLIWYGLALYKTIERKQKLWFVILFICAFVLSDLGLLPILYLIVFRKKLPSKNKKQQEKKTSKR